MKKFKVIARRKFKNKNKAKSRNKEDFILFNLDAAISLWMIYNLGNKKEVAEMAMDEIEMRMTPENLIKGFVNILRNEIGEPFSTVREMLENELPKSYEETRLYWCYKILKVYQITLEELGEAVEKAWR